MSCGRIRPSVAVLPVIADRLTKLVAAAVAVTMPVIDVVSVAALPRIVLPLTVKSPVVAKLVPVAAPISGVTKVGVFAKTKAPVPVSSEITVINSAEVVAAKKSNVFVFKPTVPVKSGNVITLSGVVGSTTVSVVWKPSSVPPSKLIVSLMNKSFQKISSVPKSSVPARSEIKEVLIATLARLDRAVVAPPPAVKSSQPEPS